jgi:dienelactone hydrolase
MSDVINVNSHGTPISTEVFKPQGRVDGAAVVLAHGSDGLTPPWADLIREFAADLAGQGFTAFIPSYFEKTGTAAGPGVFGQIPVNLDSWIATVGDVVAHVRTLPDIAAQRVGLLGFSLGGHICLRLRGVTPAMVDFFAPELRQIGGLGARQPATARIEIHHGLADLLVPFSETQAIAAALKDEGAIPEVFSYEGAGHGFAGADANNATARRSSKYRTLAFFGQHLS